ncbi:MAG TPA: biosynthetic peptidoglycan transglycosylase [Polyangiaceae bacterium]|nr:biosynthetic peptidoglycan transglycosylase [Polyangiaceae bacterium]
MSMWAFGPVVRSMAISRAHARGVELQVSSARLGWFSVQFRDADVQLTNVAGLQVHLDRVAVNVTPWLGLRGIELHGGEITLSGTPDALRDQVRAWRAAHQPPAAESSGRGRSRLALSGEGLSLRWSGVEAGSAVQVVQNIRFERAETQRASFESAHLELASATLDIGDARAEFKQTPEGAALESAVVAQIVGRIRLGDRPGSGVAPSGVAPGGFAPSGVAPSGVAPAAGAGNADDLNPDDELEEPLTTASAGTRSGASRLLAPIASVPWERRREQLQALRKLASRSLTEDATVRFERVQIELARGGSLLNVGPAPFKLSRHGSLISASFTPPSQDGKQLTLQGQLPLTDAPIEARFEGGPISLATLGVHEGDFGLLGVRNSELTVATRIALSPEGVLDMAASGQLQRLTLLQPALAQDPVENMDLGWRGQIRLDLAHHRLEIKDAGLSVEGVGAELGGVLESNGQDLRVALRLRVPTTPCQRLLEAAPSALLPQLQGLRLGGTMGLDASVDFDTAKPKETQVEWNLHNKCKVLETPEDIDPARFKQPFTQLVLDAKGDPAQFDTGPSTPQWVPITEITPYMETAVVVCEDSRFFSHHGFDDKAIANSIGDNLRAGHFVRGASTISMQLAKNLYLSREKTLSRKLQEAVFTLLLEERLSKQDILELYLNVVEFGPGIYGIRDAAMHYFNAHPGELSLGQALYLGSILPAPKANHFQADGALKKRWADHLQTLMKIAFKIHRIGDAELQAGLTERLVLGQAQTQPDQEFLNDG